MKKNSPEKQILNSDKNVMKRPPSRVLIDRVIPSVNGGRFAAKVFLDEAFTITAHLLLDGHDKAKGEVQIRHASEDEYSSISLVNTGNDEWAASFQPKRLGRHYFVVRAAIDRFGTWKADLLKKHQAEQNLSVDLRGGALLLRELLLQASAREGRSSAGSSEKSFEAVSASDAKYLEQVSVQLEKWAQAEKNPALAELTQLLEDSKLQTLQARFFDSVSVVQTEREYPLQVEPAIARFSSWYEFFPRSVVGSENKLQADHHGTLREAITRLDYIKRLGFNVVYMPPIHPIGLAFRKGKNNTLTPDASDVGSPWAIGATAGGHDAILPELGTFTDFAALIEKTRSMQMEIALDLAFQCSPDHPYVKQHPEWFKKRADGSIQYAENPPKKYQDIYPFDFESSDWENLWNELLRVVLFWVEKGVRIFRVDNPHTKSFAFWEWLISAVRAEHPEVIFLAEAFTRPKVMSYLAKAGFSQSYTYFTWRNVKWEITQYLTELTQTEMVHYFSPNFWPNTPDILPEALQKPQRAMYMQRLILAATLSSNYGIYGPVFELMQSSPLRPGSEEYLDSEKYQLRTWNLSAPESLAPFVKRINEIRQKCKPLQQTRNIKFHPITNDNLIAYSKSEGDERILVVVNLDPEHVQPGMVELPLNDWKIDPQETFEVHDLLTDARYYWHGWHNYVELSPNTPAHIFRVHSKTVSLSTTQGRPS